MHTLALQIADLQELELRRLVEAELQVLVQFGVTLSQTPTNKLTNKARVPHFSAGDNGARIWRGRPANGHLVMQIRTVISTRLLV